MPRFRPDPTFYASPSLAGEAPPEQLAYVALLATRDGQRDALGVVDTNPASSGFGRLVGQVRLPARRQRAAPLRLERLQLAPLPLRPERARRAPLSRGAGDAQLPRSTSSTPSPIRGDPQLVKVIEGDEVMAKTGYAAPHTVHCGPDGIYLNALGAPDGDGPGGIFMLDHETFEVKGRWEQDRGPQYLAYDFFWHLGQDTMITSEWGTPNMVKDGVNPELLLAGKYGHALHVWDLRRRTHLEELDLGAAAPDGARAPAGPQPEPGLRLRRRGDLARGPLELGVALVPRPERAKGKGEWQTQKVITIPAEPADAADLPPLLKGFKAVPPLVTDINLSLDDRFLYVSCWGTGELRQYDVTDPFNPVLTGSVKLGGIVARSAHPKRPDQPLNGGPQMVEVSRDGRRVYLTNSLYTPWDAQFYPDGVRGWMAKLDAAPGGGLTADPRFLVEFEDGLRPHQVRLEGGDASSDSFCYA